MQIMHSVFAAIAGLGVAVMFVCLIVLRGNSWRSAMGAFFVANIGVLGYAVGQLIRADTTSPLTMDLAIRFCQICGMLCVVGVIEVFRRGARAPIGILHRVIVALMVVCAAIAATSPGGIFNSRLTGVLARTLPWGEVLHFPISRPDPLAPIAVLFYALIAVQTARLARRRWRQGSRTQSLLMGVSAMDLIVGMANSMGILYGIRLGFAYSEVVMLIVYVVAAVQAAEAQRQWVVERDEAIARVRDSEGKLAALVGHGQTMAGILTPDGTVVLANKCALQLIGCKLEDVAGKHLADTPWWKHSSALQHRLRQAIERAAAGESDHFQATQSLPGGGQVDIDFSLTPYRDEAGTVRWLIPEGRDITELLRLERRAREEQRMEVIGQLAGGIAHDFNNMLAGILAAAELAQLDCNQPQVQESLSIVERAAERAAALTRQLLIFSRRGRARLEVFSLHSALANALALFKRMAGPNLFIVQRLGAADDRVLGELALIESAVMNLLVNARDAMAASGTVIVTTSNATLTSADTGRLALPVEPGNFLLLTVEDTGTGITAEALPRIFEPFFTTKEVGQGTGLGLATVMGCVRDHRGAIEVKSKPGEGTCFSLYLPISATGDAPVSHQRAGASFRGNGQVALVVDDEPLVRDGLTRLLAHFGFTVHAAEGSEEALALLEKLPAPPSIALLDLHMRGLNGSELARVLRERFPTLPIVLSSGNFGKWDLSTLRDDAKVCLLAKPMRQEDLLDAMVGLGVQSSE